MVDKNARKQIICTFVLSFVVMLIVLYGGNAAIKYFVHQQMVAYSNASIRESDGAENRVVLNGKTGYLGESNVRLTYLYDGFIRILGENTEDRCGWRSLSSFQLEPGNYTLTGQAEAHENSIALQLNIYDDNGFRQYLCSFDEDISFLINNRVDATLHVRVYPYADNIDIVARPAVYRDE